MESPGSEEPGVELKEVLVAEVEGGGPEPGLESKHPPPSATTRKKSGSLDDIPPPATEGVILDVDSKLLRSGLRQRQNARGRAVLKTGDRPEVARRRRAGEHGPPHPRQSYHDIYSDLNNDENRGCCCTCVETFFGTTPAPKPCGNCLYQLRWIMSGLFIALLKYVFAITCAHMIHESEEIFKSSISIGVNVQLMCMVVSQVILAPFTKIGVTVGGPDVIAAIFASAMARIIAEAEVDHEERALPTLLFCIALTTLCCAIAWLFIGYFRAARIVDYMPVCVVCGFLGCLAYKVLYYCVKISVGHEWYHPESWEFWKLLLPVIPLGLGLYYLKKYHKRLNVSPIVLLALFLVVPIVVLYIAVAIVEPEMGNYTNPWEARMSNLRHDGWLFDEMTATDFWAAWENLQWANVDGVAVALCLPSVLTTVLVVTIALLINVQASKSALKLPEVDAARELQINGWANVVCALFLAAPGYTQIKFNLLNYHIIHNTTDKKPGLFAAAFALLMLVGGFLLINYLPRITLGMLLLYAGMPLFEDNLIYSYKRVTKKEFVAIWVIVLVNAIAGVWTAYAFLIAVILGLVLAALIFAVQYGRNPVIRDTITGSEYMSHIVRPTEKRQLKKIGIRTRIMKLEGFLFFGSTIQVLNKFKKVVDENKEAPFPERVRYLIFDFTNVKNIDHSSCETFKDIKQIAGPNHIALVFAGINDKLLVKMRTHLVLPKPPKPVKKQRKSLVAHKAHRHHAGGEREHALSRRAILDAEDPRPPPRIVKRGADAAAAAAEPAPISAKHGHHDDSDHAPDVVVTVHKDLSDAAAYVEEKLLERVDYVRSHWLVFNSFRKAHQEARIKTEALIRSSCETFTAVIGSHIGSDLWKYATIRTLEKGQLLCRQGTTNTTLYVLQEGVMTSFITEAEEYDNAIHDDHHQTHKRHRLLLLTRGAFVNEECLFDQDTPLKYGVVATRRSVLWAITRKNRSRMQEDHPMLAMEILRKALQHASSTRLRRNRVDVQAKHDKKRSPRAHKALVKQRKTLVDMRLSVAAQRYSHTTVESVEDAAINVEDLDSDEEWHNLDTDHAPVVCDADDLTSGETLVEPRSSGHRAPRASVQCDSTDLVSWASSGHHHHAFHHLHVPESKSGPGGVRDKSRSTSMDELVDQTIPHLSKIDEEEARRCFHVHAQLIHLEVNNDTGTVTRHPVDEQHPHFVQTIELDFQNTSATSTMSEQSELSTVSELLSSQLSSPMLVRQMSEDKYLDLEELEKAVLDLGIYPSHDEIEAMHNALCADHPRKYADLDEFLDMIRALKLAEISVPAKRELYRLYSQRCNTEGFLSREALAQLMADLGHPEDQTELDTLMLDWDIKNRGALDFDAFLSIVSTTLKAEEVQVQIEQDFRRFDPNFSPGAKWDHLEEETKRSGDAAKIHDLEEEEADELLHYQITVDDLVRVHKEVGLELSRDVAEEMLFDTDTSGTGGVSYDDLISCIETIDTTEVHHAMEMAKQAAAEQLLWTVPPRYG